MSKIENFDMRLELFLKNKMSEEESNAFLCELKNNQELRERAQTMAAAIKNMKELKYEYGQKVASMIERDAIHIEPNANPGQIGVACEPKVIPERDNRAAAKFTQKARIISLRSIMRMGIAACLITIIALGSYRYYIYNETVALGNRYYSAIPTELVVRDADDISAQLSLLFCNVKNGEDLRNTILNLEAKFNQVISEDYNDYTNYINDIGWNLAIAHLKNGDSDKAVETLELLILHSESDLIIEKCKKLVEEVEQL